MQKKHKAEIKEEESGSKSYTFFGQNEEPPACAQWHRKNTKSRDKKKHGIAHLRTFTLG